MSDVTVVEPQAEQQAAPVVSMFVELTTAAKTTKYSETRGKGETDKDYLIRLARAIAEVSDEVWNGLSNPAQDWYNELSRTINGINPVIGVVDGFVKTDKSLDLVKPTKVAQVNNAPREIPAAPPEKRQVKGIGESIREIVIEHMDWSGEQIKAELVTKGWDDVSAKMSSITTVRADTLSVLRIAQKLGWKRG